MNYIEYFQMLGIDVRQRPCIVNPGNPHPGEGAVGDLYMDTDTGKLYKCTGVDPETDGHIWEPVEVGGYRHIITQEITTDEGVMQIDITQDKDGNPFSCSEFHIHMTIPPTQGAQLYIGSVMYSWMFFTSVARSASDERTLSIDLRHIGGGWWNGSMLAANNVSAVLNSARSGYDLYTNFRGPKVIGEKASSLCIWGGTAPFPDGTVIEIYGK